MGYYCAYWGELTIRKGHLDEITRLMRDDKTKGVFKDVGAWLSLEGVTQTISVGDSGKYHEEMWSDFFSLVKNHVTGIVEFSGDGNEHWRVTIEGGGVKEESGQIIYGDQYEQFRTEYDHKMPDELKAELDKWWISQKI